MTMLRKIPTDTKTSIAARKVADWDTLPLVPLNTPVTPDIGAVVPLTMKAKVLEQKTTGSKKAGTLAPAFNADGSPAMGFKHGVINIGFLISNEVKEAWKGKLSEIFAARLVEPLIANANTQGIEFPSNVLITEALLTQFFKAPMDEIISSVHFSHSPALKLSAKVSDVLRQCQTLSLAEEEFNLAAGGAMTLLKTRINNSQNSDAIKQSQLDMVEKIERIVEEGGKPKTMRLNPSSAKELLAMINSFANTLATQIEAAHKAKAAKQERGEDITEFSARLAKVETYLVAINHASCLLTALVDSLEAAERLREANRQKKIAAAAAAISTETRDELDELADLL